MTQPVKLSAATVDAQFTAIGTIVDVLKALGASIGIGPQGEADIAKIEAIRNEFGAFWNFVRESADELTAEGVRDLTEEALEERFCGKGSVTMENLARSFEELDAIIESLERSANWCRTPSPASPAWISGDDEDEKTPRYVNSVEALHMARETSVEAMGMQVETIKSALDTMGTLVSAYMVHSIEALLRDPDGSTGSAPDEDWVFTPHPMSAPGDGSERCPYGQSTCEENAGGLCLCGFPVQK